MTRAASDILAPPDSVPLGQRLAAVYELTKPRMNALVLVTAAVGFVVAGGTAAGVFLHAMLGTALAAAGASVLNQYLEIGRDARMPRTRRRPLVAGTLSPAFALAFGVATSALGVAYLAVAVNAVAALLAALTIVSYVAVYTPMKPRSPWCTTVGAVPGAIPPMIGVAAATGTVTPTAWALFALLFCWQMPHFFGLATLYLDDYARGGFRMLPGEPDGRRRTARQVVGYGLLLLPIGLLPALVTPGVGRGYGVVATLLGVGFLWAGLRFARDAARPAARRLFLASIAYLPLVLLALVADRLL